MNLLLDTHALIWWMIRPENLSQSALGAINDPANQIMISAVSAIEVCTKFRIGKLPEAEMLAFNFRPMIAADGFRELDVTVEHAQLAGNLDIPHKDPFDRLLIAQAQIEQMRFVSNEALFDQFGVLRLW